MGCDLIHFLDDLEDDGDLSIDEGDKLRRLAMQQKMSLLIVFKCYNRKQLRFLRYAREILSDADEQAQREKEEANAKKQPRHNGHNGHLQQSQQDMSRERERERERERVRVPEQVSSSDVVSLVCPSTDEKECDEHDRESVDDDDDGDENGEEEVEAEDGGHSQSRKYGHVEV